MSHFAVNPTEGKGTWRTSKYVWAYGPTGLNGGGVGLVGSVILRALLVLEGGGKKGGESHRNCCTDGWDSPPLRALESGDFSFLFFKIQG